MNENELNELFGIGGVYLAIFSLAQPIFSALLLIAKMHVPYICGTTKKDKLTGFPAA